MALRGTAFGSSIASSWCVWLIQAKVVTAACSESRMPSAFRSPPAIAASS